MERHERQQLNDWMSRLADGDRDAFVPLYTALWPVLRSFCRRALGEADGDDAAQQALVCLFARAIQYDPERDALSFAFGIAAWECRTARRRAERRREHPLPARAEWVDPSPPVDDEVVLRDLIRAATDVAGELTVEDRRTIDAAVRGRPADVAPATFRKRLERALARLRAAWRSKHGAI